MSNVKHKISSLKNLNSMVLVKIHICFPWFCYLAFNFWILKCSNFFLFSRLSISCWKPFHFACSREQSGSNLEPTTSCMHMREKLSICLYFKSHLIISSGSPAIYCWPGQFCPFIDLLLGDIGKYVAS